MSPISFGAFRLIYPPRASSSINPSALLRYRGYWAQYKYNDTRTLVYLLPDGSIELFNRHKQRHTRYQMTESMRRAISRLSLVPGKLHLLDGGLMHNRTRNIKDRIILWDILVHNSEYLIGTTYSYRYELLKSVCGNPTEWEQETGDEIALSINNNLWLAPVFREDYEACYAKLIHLDEVEGLVLKDPNGRLEWGLSEDNNGSWQIRVRKPNPNYVF